MTSFWRRCIYEGEDVFIYEGEDVFMEEKDVFMEGKMCL